MKARRVVDDDPRRAGRRGAGHCCEFAPQAASETVYKVLESAVANAETTEDLDARLLVVASRLGRRGPDAEALPPARPGPRLPDPQAHEPHHRRGASSRPTPRRPKGGAR